MRAAEGVDRLHVVAHGGDGGAGWVDALEQHPLRVVGVLVLVEQRERVLLGERRRAMSGSARASCTARRIWSPKSSRMRSRLRAVVAPRRPGTARAAWRAASHVPCRWPLHRRRRSRARRRRCRRGSRRTRDARTSASVMMSAGASELRSSKRKSSNTREQQLPCLAAVEQRACAGCRPSSSRWSVTSRPANEWYVDTITSVSAPRRSTHALLNSAAALLVNVSAEDLDGSPGRRRRGARCGRRSTRSCPSPRRRRAAAGSAAWSMASRCSSVGTSLVIARRPRARRAATGTAGGSRSGRSRPSTDGVEVLGENLVGDLAGCARLGACRVVVGDRLLDGGGQAQVEQP